MNLNIPKASGVCFSAVEGHSPEQCSGYVDGVRAGYAVPRQRVEALLRAHSTTTEIVDQPAQDADCTEKLVRGAAIAMLPEAERQDWQHLWKDVEQMLKTVSH
jgi:hypothetical protein